MSKKNRKRKWILVIIILSILMAAGLYIRFWVFTPREGEKKLSISNEKQPLITGVQVDYTLHGFGGKVRIKPLLDEKEWINQAAGIKGAPIDITVKRQEVKKATISFKYDDEKISEDAAERLAVAYYNEKTGRMELLEHSKVDTAAHTVSVETTHFSRYVVVDSEEWYEAWAQSQLVMRDESIAQNYFDIVFTLDCSGSMEGTDKNGLSKDCIYKFIRKLYEGDYFTVLKFNDKATCVLEEQQVEDVNSWENISASIQAIDANAGTNIEDAINVSIRHIQDSEHGATQLVILLSDGNAPVSDDVLQQAIENEIRIITIGFGSDADEELLKKIAEKTGGNYYKADEEDIDSIFEQIREEYVGIDIKNDSDNDGIPDKIETIGMRNQYGEIIRTNPNNPDTDGDGISDGMEMGEVVVDENVTETDQKEGVNRYIYFEMVTNPTIYDENIEYNPRAVVNVDSQISNDKEKIKVDVRILNEALENTWDKDSKNTINDMKNVKVTMTVPECMSSEKTEESLGNISSGEVKNIQMTCTHNGKCNGEKHIIILEVTGDGIKPIKKEIRLKGLYWFEDIKDGESMPGIQLIEKVRAYSSTYNPDKIEEVLSNEQMSQEEMAEFWNTERKDTDMRWRLNYLCNDDIYVAHQFRIYMENKNLIEKGVIDVSKLVFSDGIVNTVINQPEKNRYKQMLLEYMDSSAENLQEQYQINELVSGYESVIGTYSKLADDLQGQQAILQQQCKTAVDTINSNLEYLNGANKTPEGINERIKVLVEQSEILEKNNVKVNVTNQIDSSALQALETEYNRLSGISKAASTTTFILGITSDAIEMFSNVTKITAVAKTYADYERFLGVIAEKTKYPALKAAAEELLLEMRDRYKLYADESWNFMMNFSGESLQVLSGVGLAEFCGQASRIVSDVGFAATVGKLLLNSELGIDDMLENAVYVIGASEIADILADKVIECRDEFNENYYKSFENAYKSAEKFQYYYIELQQMRIYAEKKYLELKGMNGAREMFGNKLKEWNQYEKAHEICYETIKQVNEMTF